MSYLKLCKPVYVILHSLQSCQFTMMAIVMVPFGSVAGSDIMSCQIIENKHRI